MAHQTLTRANLVAWGTGAVTDAEFRHLDLKGFQSINGDEGGVWAPSSVIEIGGQGILVSGPFTASGVAAFTGPATFSDGVVFDNDVEILEDCQIGTSSSDVLTVFSTSTFRREAIFIEDVTIGSSASDDLVVVSNAEFQSPAIFSDDVTFGNDSGDIIDINGTANFDAPVTFSDEVEFNDVVNLLGATVNIGSSTELNFGGSARILGTPTLGVRLRYDDAGRVPWRTTTGADAATTYSPLDFDTVILPPNTLSTGRTYIIDGTGTSEGDHITIVMRDEAGGRVLNIETPGNNDDVQLVGSASEDEPRFATFQKLGSAWYCVSGYFADKT